MNKAGRIIISLVLVAAMCAPITACGSKSDIVATKADASRTYNYWTSETDGVGAGGLYQQYEQNAGIVYMTDQDRTYNTATKNADGSYTKNSETVTNKVGLHYEAPMAGASPQQSFLTSLNSGKMDVLDLSFSPDTAVELYEQGVLLDLTWWVENYMPNYKGYIERNGLYNNATVNVNGQRKYLQLYNYTEYARNWQGFQYRRDWLLKFGHPFATDVKEQGGVAAFDEQTYAEANPSWGWQEYGTPQAKWEDGILFPSWYGYHYENNGTTVGSLGTLTFDQTLYDYIHGDYADQVKNAKYTYEEYKGQWPATISDWEWMFDIFQNAIDALNYTEGYGMTLYNCGFLNSGNLVSSFGGGGVEWYQTLDTEDLDGDGMTRDVVFGADGETFKEYLRTMRKWTQNGWIDKGFQANSGQFWELDSTNVRMGYVGIYLGMNNQLLGAMDLSNGDKGDSTYGICSYGMPFPINDKYGDASRQYKTPYSFWAIGGENNSVMVTKAAETNGKDLPALFTFLDYLYGEEAGYIKAAGLNKEMLDKSQQAVRDLYAEYGLENGAWYYDEDGNAKLTPEWDALPVPTQNMLKAVRITGAELNVLPSDIQPDDVFIDQLWGLFESKGFLPNSFYMQLTTKQYSIYQTSLTNIRNSFLSNVPGYILNGNGDFDESGFDQYIKELKRQCNVDTLTKALDDLAHEFAAL